MENYNRSRLIQAINKFNDQDFFECHEILEDIWFDVRDDSRDFYQGLLHIAVGFYHLSKKKNQKGTVIQLNKALDKLTKFGNEFRGIELDRLVISIKNIIKKLNKKELPKKLPKIIIN
ncbi:MAG: DUF309 domain-containing protein [Ignavibacteria bacterium]|nr:DUF309 domain-containing protein [Ignavibacteria bacterium]MCC7158167.1 DUF309 domain-containing protein [Ignavibacteria bacterium]